jgi:dUTP pyrophosphatase
MRIPLVQIDPGLPLPAHAKPGDAGLDLRAREGVVIKAGGGRAIVPCGIRIAIPDGFAGFVLPRSGLARDHGVTCLNTPGLVDSGYRGEIMVLLVNTDPSDDFAIERGERIAQLVIQRYETVEFDLVDTLDDSERGSGGFGHTGR